MTKNSNGSGVALYVSDKLEFQVIKCGPNGLEFLLVSVHNADLLSLHPVTFLMFFILVHITFS